jgi:hypothetical protein
VGATKVELPTPEFGHEIMFRYPIDGNNKRTLHLAAILSNGAQWRDEKKVRLYE